MKNKGFTIIELLIALFLFSILISMVFSVTAFCMKSLSDMDKDVELQQQAQFIFNFIEDKIIESTGLVYLEDKSGFLKHNTKDKVCLKKVIFRNLPQRVDKGYIFGVSKDPEFDYFNLKYGIGTIGSASVEVGNYIESIEVLPIPIDKNYIEADGIALTINFILDGYSSTFQTSYHYRNSDGRF